VRGVDTKVHHELPPSVVPAPPRGVWKSGIRECLVVEAPRIQALYAVHNDTRVNLLRGLVERVFLVPSPSGLVEPPRPDRLAEKLRDAYKLLTRGAAVIPVLTREEFCLTYRGDGRRQRRYEAACQSLEETPLNRKDAHLETFVKCEKINFSRKPDPAPRVIQPRKPRFGVEFGRYIKALEHPLYKRIGQRFYRHPCIAKGFNALETARLIREKWDKFTDPVCVGMDASRFDQHVSVEALEWTHRVYCAFFSNDAYLRSLCAMLIENKGMAYAKDGAFKYSVTGRRMSGDMDTALGNCLLMCAMTWSYCRTRGIRHHVMNNGDDIIVIMERRDLRNFQSDVVAYFKGLGFTMEVEQPVDVFEKIEFCQTHPVWNGESWVMCRGPIGFSKDLCCTIGTSDIRPWLGAVGECGMALSSGLPCLQEGYTWMVGNGVTSNAKAHPAYACGMSRMAVGMEPKWREVSQAARYSFYLAFGILPDQQVNIENEYRRLGRVGEIQTTPKTKDELHDMHSAWWEPYGAE